MATEGRLRMKETPNFPWQTVLLPSVANVCRRLLCLKWCTLTVPLIVRTDPESEIFVFLYFFNQRSYTSFLIDIPFQLKFFAMGAPLQNDIDSNYRTL